MIHIIIITFNRSKSLLQTLLAIENSVFNKFKLTILDNSSTDETRIVSEEYCRGKSNVKYVINKVNIGACANAMRAYELADEEYTWIICDDDAYDFNDSKELLNILTNKKPDVLIVGTPVENKSIKYLKYAENINRIDSNAIGKAIFAMSFLPAAIIKSSRLSSCDYRIGYNHLNTLFPQFFWISESINNKWNIIVNQKYLIKRPHSESGIQNGFDHINGYLKCLYLFKSKLIARKAYDIYFEDKLTHVRILISAIMRCKSIGLNTALPMIEHIIYNPFISGKIISLLVLPITLIPESISVKYLHWRSRVK